ncbi:MAG TPA: hypothetical protein VLH85_09575 [Levilinea sp.]|nr:hypothetical protein [Levilinea sp.]
MDTALVLTRGSPIGAIAMLTNLNPSHGSFTGVARSPKSVSPLIGQLVYHLGERSARLAFFTPVSSINNSNLTGLVERMAEQAGVWGAFNLLAELPEDHETLEGMRRCGFVVYARQHIWRLPPPNGKHHRQGLWAPVNSKDETGIRNLFHCLVPPLAQGAESFPVQHLKGFVHRQRGEALAFVEGIYGPRGIYLLPLFHPTLENVDVLISDLLLHLTPLVGRPVYMAVRSYQSWIDNALEALSTQEGERQVLLVKHLAHIQRVPAYNSLRAAIENSKVEPTVSIQMIALPQPQMADIEE